MNMYEPLFIISFYFLLHDVKWLSKQLLLLEYVFLIVRFVFQSSGYYIWPYCNREANVFIHDVNSYRY
jgi:hypothetical protein